MPQFDVYPIADGDGFWVDCQTELMEHFDSRFVVPLMPVTMAPQPKAARLNPAIQIDGETYVLLTQFAGTIPRDELHHPAGSLEHERYVIMNALDFLLSGT